MKLAYDPSLECFVMSKAIMLGLTYPFDWGFMPRTLGDDGDPLDAFIMHHAATSPGLVLRCRIVGVLKTEQREKKKAKERNDRFVAVPILDQREEKLKDVRDLPKELREEIEQFFIATVCLEDKQLKFLGWGGPKEARELIRAGAKKYRKAEGKQEKR